MKKLFIGEYLRMFQVGNGFSDLELEKRSGIDASRIKYIFANPEDMTTKELARLAKVFDLEIQFSRNKCVNKLMKESLKR